MNRTIPRFAKMTARPPATPASERHVKKRQIVWRRAAQYKLSCSRVSTRLGRDDGRSRSPGLTRAGMDRRSEGVEPDCPVEPVTMRAGSTGQTPPPAKSRIEEDRSLRRQDHRRPLPRRGSARRGRHGHQRLPWRKAQGHRQEGGHQGPARRDGPQIPRSPGASSRRRRPRRASAIRTYRRHLRLPGRFPDGVHLLRDGGFSPATPSSLTHAMGRVQAREGAAPLAHRQADRTPVSALPTRRGIVRIGI